ncbi:MAG: PIN domain-containing protein [Pseudonocardiaceae bacterium]
MLHDYSDWCLVDTDPLLIISASRLSEQHSINFWDALIVEAALRAGAAELVTEDLQHGRRFGKLQVRNPFLPQEDSPGLGHGGSPRHQ